MRDAKSPRSRGRPRKLAGPQEILPAALRVFAATGFAATRLEDVARAAGLSKAALYLYFDSKEAIFEALVRSAVVPNVERVEREIEAWSGSAAELLRMLLTRLGRAMIESEIAVFPKLIIAEATNFPALADFYRQAVIDRALGLFARVVARGVASGEFRATDPALAARLCIAPLLLSALWRTCFARPGDGSPEATALLDLHADTVLRGLA
jgi:AcrR family transcriptional regulator